jgi:hypothetical protein
MARFVVGNDRSQSTLFPERLDEYLGEDNPVRAIDVFVDELDLGKLGFDGVEEREGQRNIELVWLIGRLMPDFKTIADFRKDNGDAIRKMCREFEYRWAEGHSDRGGLSSQTGAHELQPVASTIGVRLHVLPAANERELAEVSTGLSKWKSRRS